MLVATEAGGEPAGLEGNGAAGAYWVLQGHTRCDGVLKNDSATLAAGGRGGKLIWRPLSCARRLGAGMAHGQ